MNLTHATDSIIRPFTSGKCTEQEAPTSARERQTMTLGRVPYTQGIVPGERTSLPGYDSGVLCLLVVVFILLTYNFRHYSTFLKNFTTDLWSVRRTERTFTVRTVSEVGIQGAVVLVVCLCEGIIINSSLPAEISPLPLTTFAIIATLTLAAGLFYLWQLGVYRIVGYVFADRLTARQWLKGFNASQTLLGILLVLPALIVLFNPEQSHVVIRVSIGCYVASRLIFILKGFRLFYSNFGSLLYFILYLCSLEIVPLVIIYRCIGFSTAFNA